MYFALLKRWWYLLTVGMWRGECSVTIWDGWRPKVIGSGVPVGRGVLRDYRIWWSRA